MFNILNHDWRSYPACEQWAVDQGALGLWPAPGLTRWVNSLPQYDPPPWLRLPADQYDTYPFLGYQYTSILWIADAHVFMLGRFEGTAQRPTASTDIFIGHQQGWLIQQNGLTSVVISLSARDTFFFAGSMPADEVLSLTENVVGHLGQLLRPEPSSGQSNWHQCSLT